MILNIYYLDDPLTDEELEFLKETLCEWETFKSIQDIRQVRVPSVFPSKNIDGKYEGNISERIELVKKNLINAGIQQDIGTQVVWIQPKEVHWGVTCSTAIGDITGFLPYIIQRWFFDNDKDDWYRDSPRITDSHSAFGLKK